MSNTPVGSVSSLHLSAEINYQIDPQPLGVGGFSVVHRAWEPDLERWVALKIVTVSKVLREMGITREELEARHRNEIRAAGSLRHDHVVEIYNYGRGEDTLWYAMTLLTGGSIRSRIRPGVGKPPAVDSPDHLIQWLEILVRLCRNVGYIHAAGILHRDLKPDNILFDERGRPTITDFGLARIGDEEHTESVFAGGDQVHSAPELLLGEPQDGRTDVYSLGCLCHFALTSREPFKYVEVFDAIARDERAALKRQIHPAMHPGSVEDFTLPQEANPTLREDLARILLRAMSGDPDQRYDQPRHLADALEEQLDIERTLRRIPAREFVAERAAPILSALLRRPESHVDAASLLGQGATEADTEVRRIHLRELVRQGFVLEHSDGYSLARRLDLRSGRRQREKQALAEHLVKVITALDPPIGLSVDGGSTTNEVLRALLRQPVEVRERIGAMRTNNTCWVWDALNKPLPPGWRLLGGWVRPASLATLGRTVIEHFRAFSPAASIIGVMGLVTDPSAAGEMSFSVDTEEEAQLKRVVIESANLLSIIAFDSTKFGVGAGEPIVTLGELVALAHESRGHRRILLATTHPSIYAHSGSEAPAQFEADRQKFIAGLRELLLCIVRDKGDRDVRLTLSPVALIGQPSHAPITLPAKGDSVENLPFIFNRHLAELTAISDECEVAVTIEL